jgi:hypothetical protein
MNSRALLLATLLGTILQVAMVVAGHSNKTVAGLFAVGGMGFSLVAGLAYAMWARGGSTSSLAVGGLVAGALCALIGIFVSYMLGDVPVTLLLLGTVSSAVTGALGGWIGKFIFRAGAGAAVAALVLAMTGSSTNADKTLMSTQPRVTTYKRIDATTFVGRSDIIGDDGKPGVVEVTYRRIP